MIPRVPLREALSDPNLLGTAIAGDSWRSWRTLPVSRRTRTKKLTGSKIKIAASP
jgi:hypothetical protein